MDNGNLMEGQGFPSGCTNLVERDDAQDQWVRNLRGVTTRQRVPRAVGRVVPQF